MKKLSALLSCLLFVIGCATTETKNRDSISEVLKARREAIIECCPSKKPVVRNNRVVNMNRAKFVSLLSHIDASNCPKEFRVAWSDYVYANQKLNASKPGLLELAGVGFEVYLAAQTGGATALTHAAVATKETSEIDKKKKSSEEILSDSWHECIKLAAFYGAK